MLILAAMLLPALNNARESGRTANCISNKKQIGLMLSSYFQTYDDYILAHRVGGTPSTLYYARYNGYVSEETFQNYYKCTSIKEDADWRTANQYYSFAVYIYSVLGYADGTIKAKVNKIKAPSQKGYMFENKRAYYMSTSSNTNEDTRFYGRHNGKGIILYVDGHATAERQDYIRQIVSGSPAEAPILNADIGS